MLRVIPGKLAGIAVMSSAILAVFLLPWLDRGTVRSVRYRGLGYRIALALFAMSFVLLGAVGAGVSATLIPRLFGAAADVTWIENAFGRFWTAVYFGYFLFTWIYTRFGLERTRPVPARVTFGTD
jgi:ubiquinol-cytochrome c reductase cytochrome b subunit